MKIKKIKIKDLKMAEYNPRVMNVIELEKLKNSIKEFGMVEPIVVNKDLTVIGGHQRIKALKMLKYDEVPCIVVDIDKKKEKLLNLALNRISGDWDQDKLAKLVKEISEYPDVKLSGLSEAELEMLTVQYDLVFGNKDNKIDGEDEVKRMFDLNMSVPIDVERPQVVKKENKVAFFTENIEEYNKIKNYFKTKNRSELDTKKLLDLIE